MSDKVLMRPRMTLCIICQVDYYSLYNVASELTIKDRLFEFRLVECKNALI